MWMGVRNTPNKVGCGLPEGANDNPSGFAESVLLQSRRQMSQTGNRCELSFVATRGGRVFSYVFCLSGPCSTEAVL